MPLYSTIVADPPWRQMRGPDFDGRANDTRIHRAVGSKTNSVKRPLIYPTLSVEEIKTLPVQTVAAQNSHLYLWVTNHYVEDAYSIARAWGFKPVSLLVWAKAPMGLGPGGAFVQTTEFVLFARRGRDIRKARSETTWWQWTRARAHSGAPVHSGKPDAFIDMVETVSPGPYLELFARRQRLGWKTWGDECFAIDGIEAS